MNKTLILCGAAAFALGVASEAEARKATYEINGNQYSYDTSDPQQVASARKRIDAANAAYAARTKADAERADMPLVGVFGSPVQTEAKQAQEHLEKVIAEEEDTDAARKEGWSSLTTTKNWRRKQSAKQAPQPETAETQPVAEPQTANAANPNDAQNRPRAMVKSVSFDVTSGIKTTVMMDGAIQEEPFDSTMLTKLAFEQGGANSLTDFVKQIREASPQPAPAAPSNPASPQN
ncbi:hypothetical protein [Microvirga terricola]|uniref:Uncharacterized protein n=1 Tax=Microvirga terricola TaxID=2719797 RepID=A0ABX0VFB1_9HYPH|nr:hypothetical protein [Microvirga terricola]NIX77041.1 hypothetical protein [Microvirga terricola]